jgi:hypothetical protein
MQVATPSHHLFALYSGLNHRRDVRRGARQIAAVVEIICAAGAVSTGVVSKAQPWSPLLLHVFVHQLRARPAQVSSRPGRL